MVSMSLVSQARTTSAKIEECDGTDELCGYISCVPLEPRQMMVAVFHWNPGR